MTTNPYHPPDEVLELQRNATDVAKLVRGGFLYRKISISEPFECLLIYNGWNFLQRIFLDDVLVWKRISWIVIHRHAEFAIPNELYPPGGRGELQIEFGRGLRVRRFCIHLAGRLVYEET